MAGLRALLIAYVLGGLTFVPLLCIALFLLVLYTSTPVGDLDPAKLNKAALQENAPDDQQTNASTSSVPANAKPRQGWVILRRTFEEPPQDSSYVNQMVRSFLDARSKDPKRARPRDTYYAVLKGSVLFLYEDEAMSECHAAIEVSGYDVEIYPPGGLDGELFAKRNAIIMKAKQQDGDEKGNRPEPMRSVTKAMKLGGEEGQDDEKGATQDEKAGDAKKNDESTSTPHPDSIADDPFDQSKPWFMFVKSNTQMEDWYLSLVHASSHPSSSASTASPTLLDILQPIIFDTADMQHLVSTLDSQPDPIPMRWLNALIGRIFFSVYKTAAVESFLIGRLMRKLSKVKKPAFLTDISVREVSVGTTAPTLSKPMLKELTKEGDASVELGLHYKGEVRITVEATASINLGSRFKSYTVKLVLAVVLKELQGNLHVRLKGPPSNRIWYAFTSMPKLEMEVLPVVSDRQIRWSMILKPIESMLRDVIQESVVLPNMDDIPFFDTTKYQIRGGIFPDAARVERPDTDTTPSTIPNDPQTPNLNPSTPELNPSNLPPLDHTGSPSTPEPGVGRSETSISLPPMTNTLVDSASSRLHPVATEPNLSSVSSSPPTKRSSWFSGPKFGLGTGKDDASTSAPTLPTLVDSPQSETSLSSSLPDRGRVNTASGAQSERRAKSALSESRVMEVQKEESIPSAPVVQVSDVSNAPDTTTAGHVSSRPSTPTRNPSTGVPRTLPRLRSPTLSHKNSYSVGSIPSSITSSSGFNSTAVSNPSSASISSIATAETAPTPGSSSTTVNHGYDMTPSSSSSASTSANASAATTASSLLASWKARDKQALQATARDAMKKWGWGKNSNNSGPSDPKDKDTGKAKEEERNADALSSSVGSSSSKPTFAELRAQVEERRKEREARGGSISPLLAPAVSIAGRRSPSPESQPNVPLNASSPPIDIPLDRERQTEATRQRTLSTTSGASAGVSPPWVTSIARRSSSSSNRSSNGGFTGGLGLGLGSPPGSPPSSLRGRSASSRLATRASVSPPNNTREFIAPSMAKTTTEVVDVSKAGDGLPPTPKAEETSTPSAPSVSSASEAATNSSEAQTPTSSTPLIHPTPSAPILKSDLPSTPATSTSIPPPPSPHLSQTHLTPTPNPDTSSTSHPPSLPPRPAPMPVPVSPVNAKPPLPNRPKNQQPLYSQQPAMIIPGIHASHRGDVMALGSSPPPPPPSAPKAPSTKSEGASSTGSGPKINVMGMWKVFGKRGSVSSEPTSETSSNGGGEGSGHAPALPPRPDHGEGESDEGSEMTGGVANASVQQEEASVVDETLKNTGAGGGKELEDEEGVAQNGRLQLGGNGLDGNEGGAGLVSRAPPPLPPRA